MLLAAAVLLANLRGLNIVRAEAKISRGRCTSSPEETIHLKSYEYEVCLRLPPLDRHDFDEILEVSCNL